MYADRYAKQKKLDPTSLGLSALLVGGIMTGMIFSAPDFVKTMIPEPIEIYDVKEKPLPPPNPEPLPKKQDILKPKADTRIIPPEQHVTIDMPKGFTITPGPDKVEITEGTSTGLGGGEILTKPAPVLTDAMVDPRYASYYQPEYPNDERRMGRQGRVVIKVLIGTDGRVKQVELVSSPSSSFFDATKRRALDKWRFKPGTRDGVPMETWKTMAVRFVLNDD
jgi:protein TonB